MKEILILFVPRGIKNQKDNQTAITFCLIFYLLFFLLWGCNSDKNGLVKRKIGDYLVEGNFIGKDSIDGRATFYDVTGKNS